MLNIALVLRAAWAVLAVIFLFHCWQLICALAAVVATAKKDGHQPNLAKVRIELYGLLWFPVLTVDPVAKMILSAVTGPPHCPNCLKPLALVKTRSQEWVCGVCKERRPGSVSNLQVLDTVVAQAIHGFVSGHAGYRSAPGLPDDISPQ